MSSHAAEGRRLGGSVDDLPVTANERRTRPEGARGLEMVLGVEVRCITVAFALRPFSGFSLRGYRKQRRVVALACERRSQANGRSEESGTALRCKPECLDDYLSFTLFGPRVRICTACESRCAHLLRLAVSSLIKQGVGQILSRFRLEPHETLVRLLAHPRVMGLCQHAVQHPREGLIARVALPPIVP